MTKEDIENRFTYHAPKDGQLEIYQNIRTLAKELALEIDEVVPEGREKSIAITKLEEAVMWANSGIARHGGTIGEWQKAMHRIATWSGGSVPPPQPDILPYR